MKNNWKNIFVLKNVIFFFPSIFVHVPLYFMNSMSDDMKHPQAVFFI